MAPSSSRFAEIVRHGGPDFLVHGALEIARLGHPDLDPAQSLRHLDELATGVRSRLHEGDTLADQVRHLVQHLFVDGGFTGNRDRYYDPRNSFLNEVLQRRTGIPITLSVVMIEVGRRAGVPLEGVGFPGHFLVSATTPTGRLVLDPFLGGRALDEAELTERLRAFQPTDGPAATDLLARAVAPTPPRAILARMLRNLLQIYTEQSAWRIALATVEHLRDLEPDAADARKAHRHLTRLVCALPTLH